MTNQNEPQADNEQETVEESEELEEEYEESTLDRVKELQERYYKACGDLDECASYLGEPLSELMLQHYYEQYKRDYERMNAEEFIETDKYIEELKIRRDRELEEIKLKHDKLLAELDKVRVRELEGIKLEHDKMLAELDKTRDETLKEIQLEHDKLKAEVAGKRERIAQELDALKEVIKAECEAKADEMKPQDLPRRWWQRHSRPNYAKELVMQEAEIELDQYFDERERAIEEKTKEHRELKEILETILPKPRKKSKRKKWEKQLEALALVFERKAMTREEAEAEIGKIIHEADGKAPEEALREPKNGLETPDTDKDEEEAEEGNEPAGAQEMPEERG